MTHARNPLAVARCAVLIGGPFDRRKVTLSRTPLRILVGSRLYLRLDDPDTGEYLGGYALQNPSSVGAA